MFTFQIIVRNYYYIYNIKYFRSTSYFHHFIACILVNYAFQFNYGISPWLQILKCGVYKRAVLRMV